MPQGMAPGTQAAFAAALRHHQTGRLEEAERLYRQILQADPNHADALHLLGVIAHQRGRNQAALELLDAAITHNGRVASFHNNRGNVLKVLGRLDEALASYHQALTLKPDHAEAYAHVGSVLQAQGQLEAAVAAYRQALTLKPGSAETHNNLGNTLQAQGKLDDAVAAYACALALKPGYAEAHGNLGNVLKAQGRLEDAVASYRRALALKPDYAQAHNNLGIVLLERESLDEAVASFGRALALKPDYVDAQTHLGHALKEQGHPEEAQAAYRRALALNPDDADARLGLAIAAIPLMPRTVEESTAAVEAFSRSLEELTSWSQAHPGMLGRSAGRNQPFYLTYRPSDVSGVLARYGDLVSTEAAEYWQRNTAASPAARHEATTTGQRIRMVIVSGQVRRHPAWDVILRGIVAHLDRRQFETILYHTSPIVDEETRWANAHVDRFVQGPRSIRGWLKEIASDRPEIVFYPEVGMDPATCSLATLRLAPLQVASWGHPATTGLPTIDMYLSGELLEGQAAERHYRERLVRLPGTGVCTETDATQAQPWEGPSRQPGTVRFALCQQPIKFDPADDALWVRIARAAGPAEFWLAAPHKLRWATQRLKERLAAAFGAAGLDPQAVRVMPWLPRERFMAFLDDVDVYLDCPAFSGYTTAWQAVHRGLPIVTLEGEFLRQRLAAGLLRQIGLCEGIAHSPEQYLETASRWSQEARNTQAWAARRAALRSAAGKADGNRLAVSALQQVLAQALRGA